HSPTREAMPATSTDSTADQHQGKAAVGKMSIADQHKAELLSSLHVSTGKLRAIAAQIQSEFSKGLNADGQTVKMIPSYVHTLPTGSEQGTYLALDLGGTNFRVCAIQLQGCGELETVFDKFTIPDTIKVGSAMGLFDFVADCVHKFLTSHASELAVDNGMDLGFTFSFPVHQTSFVSGTCISWTKGFDCPDALGQDATALLQAALTRKGVNVRVTALVNDTVGTLVAHAYKSPNTVVGMILGTGSNAAYIERVDRIPKFAHKVTPKMAGSGQMLINTELGGFDAEKVVLPLTQIDLDADAVSTNRGQQLFEKMISGYYMGEVTRRAMVHLAEKGALFGGRVSAELRNPGCFQTEYMSEIEADASPDLAAVKSVLAKYCAMDSTSLADRESVKQIVQRVGTRAARLSGVAIYSLLEQMAVPKNNEPVVVAIDGSVWLKYPGFQDRLRSVLSELMGDEKAKLVSLETACDGSGSGAALLAALAPLHAEDARCA
ncbi:hexokinase-domain-containing protein, partial [Catenaria anguillulae PL171]